MSLIGHSAPQRMVQADTSGNRFVPYLSTTYVELLKVGDTWHLKTINNLEYTFRPYGTSGALWVLTDIQDLVGTDHVHIDYDTGPGLGSCGPDLHITKLSYAYGANSQPLYEIDLTYDGWWHAAGSAGGNGCASRAGGAEVAGTFDRSPDDMLQTNRSTVVTSIAVRAHDNLDVASSAKVIRSYDFQYVADLDTAKPRLKTVVMHGEDGTGSEALVSYDYGSLSNGGIQFAKPRAVPRSASLPSEYADDVSASEDTTQAMVGLNDPWLRARMETTRSRHMIRDFTGDGLPDEVWKEGSKWHLAKGWLGVDGARLDGPEVTWTAPAELFEQTTFRYLEPANQEGTPHSLGIVSETWTQFMDWNGDGRLDIVDARDSPMDGRWRVWINEDDGQGGISWRATETDMSAFRAFQYAHSLNNVADTLRYSTLGDVASDGRVVPHTWEEDTPLARTRSWPRVAAVSCQEIGCKAGEQPELGTDFDGVPIPGNCSGDTYECQFSVPYQTTFGSDTWTEWAIKDFNEDGFPDIVSESNGVAVCDGRRGIDAPTRPRDGSNPWPGLGTYLNYQHVEIAHSERLRYLPCPAPFESPQGTSEPVVFLNHVGAFEEWATAPVLGAFGANAQIAPPHITAHLDRWFGGVDTDGATRWDNGAWRTTSYQTSTLADPFSRGALRPSTMSDGNNAHQRFMNNRGEKCTADASNTYTDQQTSADLDINGDGLLDVLSFDPTRVWWTQLEINTGIGYVENVLAMSAGIKVVVA